MKPDLQRGVRALKKYKYPYISWFIIINCRMCWNLFQSVPDQKLVIDHCAHPEYQNKNSEWKAHIKELGDVNRT